MTAGIRGPSFQERVQFFAGKVNVRRFLVVEEYLDLVGVLVVEEYLDLVGVLVVEEYLDLVGVLVVEEDLDL